MTRLCGVIFAMLVWGLTMTPAWAAEPAVKCRLTTGRVEAFTTNDARWRESVGYRCTDSQNLARWTGKNDSRLRPEKPFQRFAQVVKKEPGKYFTKHPFRCVAVFGSREYGFVLDRKDGDAVEYSRLYFDLNANGDLTDDEPIDLSPDAAQLANTPSGLYYVRVEMNAGPFEIDNIIPSAIQKADLLWEE